MRKLFMITVSSYTPTRASKLMHRPGAKLCHNCVRPDGKNAFGRGEHGSRAWISNDPKCIGTRCHCNYAPDVPVHYTT
jgi:hypothetical protein